MAQIKGKGMGMRSQSQADMKKGKGGLSRRNSLSNLELKKGVEIMKKKK